MKQNSQASGIVKNLEQYWTDFDVEFGSTLLSSNKPKSLAKKDFTYDVIRSSPHGHLNIKTPKMKLLK